MNENKLTVTLDNKPRTIELKEVYTRKIDKEYKQLMYKNSSTSGDEEGKVDFKIDPMSFDIANDYLVMTMASLSQDEVDSLSVMDYDKILKVINEMKNPDGSVGRDTK